MAHITFYRKYRSQTFNEIVGQTHIVQTLGNAITHDRLSHAYIFSGPRGTGKTSTARILAKSLNCRSGKSTTPCITCDLCQKISQGNSIDIIEIDAASNTGVDNIRTLNDQVNFTPIECKYKVYIIDEAHMLSGGAFNALLKTLEEPPANTLFILATTEPHKIPVTIHSRCQHLQFRMMTNTEIITQLRFIAEKESITIDNAGLRMIARNSGGSMRDAVSLLDQMTSFKGTTITYEDVMVVLGGMNTDELIDILGACLQKKIKDVVAKLDQLSSSGCNITQLTQDFILIVKDMILVKMGLESNIEGDTSYCDLIKKAIGSADFNQLSTLLETLAKTELDLKWFPRQELLLQVRLLSTMTDSQAPPITIQPLQKVTATTTSSAQAPAPPAIKAASQPARPAQTTPISQIVAPQKSGPDQQLWENCLEKIKLKKQSIYSILKDSVVTEKKPDALQISLKQDFKFFREKLKEESNKIVIHGILREVFGQPLTLQIGGAPTETKAAGNQEETQSISNSTPLPKKDTPQAMKINHIIQLFEGTLVS